MNHEVIVGIRENSDLEELPSAVGTDVHREIRLVRCRDGNDRIVVGMADVLVGDPCFRALGSTSMATTVVVASTVAQPSDPNPYRCLAGTESSRFAFD